MTIFYSEAETSFIHWRNGARFTKKQFTPLIWPLFINKRIVLNVNDWKIFSVNHKKDVYIACKMWNYMKRNYKQEGSKHQHYWTTFSSHVRKQSLWRFKNSHNAAADAAMMSEWPQESNTNRALKLQDCNREQQQQSVCFLVNDAVQY